MAADEFEGQYFVYEARLASFHGPQPVSKRRVSTANSRAPKTLTWPHKTPNAVALANAGFYFHPHPSNPDNVRCFLCHKEMDGWEADDDPLAEHLKHSGGCGWAICAAIEAELGDAATEDPRQAHLLEARKATFAGQWPYEGKKGWKCKTKQLAEAGWKYTPTLDSDDKTTCTYCQLALDGWEASDKPLDEHQRRSPDCPFFTLISQHPAPKKAARGRAPRGSKASRVSMQSTATVDLDTRSVSDAPAEHEDSVMTTTSVMTQGSKKGPKGRKAAPTGKGRKPRAKKDDPVEVRDDGEAGEMEGPAPPKPTRGRKRASDAMEDSVLTNAEAPAPKKRATRVRGSNAAVDASVLTLASQPDVDMEPPNVPAKAPAGRKKGRTASATKRPRKGSAASIASTASTASLRSKPPTDDELNRQLEADLDRPLTDDELVGDSDSERRKAAAAAPKPKGKRIPSRKAPAPSPEPKTNFAMFDPAPSQPDEAAVEADFRVLETEMAIDLPAEEIKIPKKGRKGTTRKASKQTRKEDAPAVHDELPAEPVAEPEAELEMRGDQDMSTASTGTVVKGSPEPHAPAKRGRGRPPKKSKESQVVEPTAAALPRAVQMLAAVTVDDAEETTAIRHSVSVLQESLSQPTAKPPAAATPRGQASAIPQPKKVTLAPPSTPRAHQAAPAPFRSALQAVLSPSPSPQSSDAENQPPSSKPSGGGRRLAPEPPATPAAHRGSPSKRAPVLGGLRSEVPWTAADLELVFGADRGGEAEDPWLPRGAALTAAESAMTVREWIYDNAGRAEERLRHECESMVSAFEREGTRAMRVLEGLVVD